MSAYYFGQPSSSQEDLSRLYPELLVDLLDSIKCVSQPDGKYLIGGIRGSGKTALRLLFEQRLREVEPQSLCSVIDFNHIIPSFSYLQSPNLYFHLVANWILIHVHNLYVRSMKGRSRIRLVTDRISEVLGDTITEGSVKAAGVELSLDFEKLRAGGIPTKVSNLKIYDYRERFDKIPDLVPAYVLIDDFDTVFEGSTRNDPILYAALNAIGAINDGMGRHVHIIVFPNLALQRKYVKSSPEARKYRGRVTEISWSTRRLRRLISLRIKQIRKPKEEQSSLDLWKLEFKNADKLRQDILRMNVSGPGDLIELCNLAKQNAGSDRIGSANLKAVLFEFAENKFDDIERDFGGMYPEIGQLLKLTFLALPTFKTRKELIDGLRTLRVQLRATDQVPSGAQGWFRDCRLGELVQVFFDCGCLGVRSGKALLFFRDDPSLSLPKNDDAHYEGHPLMTFWTRQQHVDRV